MANESHYGYYYTQLYVGMYLLAVREEFSKRLKLACWWKQAEIILYLGNCLNLHFSEGVSKDFHERVGSMISCFCNFVGLHSWLEVEERSEKLVGASFLWRSTVGWLLVGHPFAAAFSVMLLLESWYVIVTFNFLRENHVSLCKLWNVQTLFYHGIFDLQPVPSLHSQVGLLVHCTPFSLCPVQNPAVSLALRSTGTDLTEGES